MTRTITIQPGERAYIPVAALSPLAGMTIYVPRDCPPLSYLLPATEPKERA